MLVAGDFSYASYGFVAVLTVAAQHILTSYRCPSRKPCSSNQVDSPYFDIFVGNSARTCVLKDQCCGERLSRRRSSRVGCSRGTWSLLGPRNMAFSVLEMTVTNREKSSRSK